MTLKYEICHFFSLYFWWLEISHHKKKLFSVWSFATAIVTALHSMDKYFFPSMSAVTRARFVCHHVRNFYQILFSGMNRNSRHGAPPWLLSSQRVGNVWYCAIYSWRLSVNRSWLLWTIRFLFFIHLRRASVYSEYWRASSGRLDHFWSLPVQISWVVFLPYFWSQ